MRTNGYLHNLKLPTNVGSHAVFHKVLFWCSFYGIFSRNLDQGDIKMVGNKQ